ncbi:unnamed protein product [Prorocentrum cordatum]|uniref:Uncharacterized protein n=1 Tax=Prorocentrum cordatum TaxID=2364126 RepID=A0ABN9QFU6_9DINO|nr:unnamed protein product [Polarella glacialis]
MMRALAGSGDTWYVYDHEFAFVEVCVLLAMIPIVNVFDMVWHTISHRVERTSFVYGAKKRVEDDEDSHGHDPHEEHKQLGVILLSRMGTEFMTLGFLALLVFTSEYNGLFDELVDILPTGCSDGGSYYRRLAEESDCLHLPKSGLDWFHMFEIVHFSLFGGVPSKRAPARPRAGVVTKRGESFLEPPLVHRRRGLVCRCKAAAF